MGGGGPECCNRIGDANFLTVFHSNYGSILSSFRDKTTGWQRATSISRHRHDDGCHSDDERRRGMVSCCASSLALSTATSDGSNCCSIARSSETPARLCWASTRSTATAPPASDTKHDSRNLKDLQMKKLHNKKAEHQTKVHEQLDSFLNIFFWDWPTDPLTDFDNVCIAAALQQFKETVLLERYSPTPYHYATPMVGHFPRALTKEQVTRRGHLTGGR